MALFCAASIHIRNGRQRLAASNLKCNTPFRIEASMSKRTYEQITESERHAIALGLQQKQSLRAIARALAGC